MSDSSSFDYIRELCGQYSELYYQMKERGSKITSRTELADWERDIKSTCGQLSEMENKTLHLMKNRLWKRIGSR